MQEDIVITGTELMILLNPKNLMKVLAGLSGLLFEKIDSAVPGNGTMPDNGTEVKAAPITVPVAVKADDLTQINGIGPTFARRLQEAGINSFRKLAELTPEYLKEVTKAADWQADPAAWIAQAKALA